MNFMTKEALHWVPSIGSQGLGQSRTLLIFGPIGLQTPLGPPFVLSIDRFYLAEVRFPPSTHRCMYNASTSWTSNSR